MHYDMIKRVAQVENIFSCDIRRMCVVFMKQAFVVNILLIEVRLTRPSSDMAVVQELVLFLGLSSLSIGYQSTMI